MSLKGSVEFEVRAAYKDLCVGTRQSFEMGELPFYTWLK